MALVRCRVGCTTGQVRHVGATNTHYRRRVYSAACDGSIESTCTELEITAIEWETSEGLGR